MALGFLRLISFLSEYVGVSNLIILTLFTLLIFNWLQDRRQNSLPPGPVGLPLVGYVPLLRKAPHETLVKLSKKYGDIMSLKLFGKNIVHLNSYKAIREAFLENGEDFMGRPQDLTLLHWMFEGKGLFQAEGSVWKEHRHFAVHALKEFGFGKLKLEGHILDIANDLMQVMRKSQGKATDFGSYFSASTANVICSLVFNKHYEFEDPEFVDIRQQVRTFFRALSIKDLVGNPLVTFVPWKLIPGYPYLMGFKKRFYSHMEKIIQEHEDTFDPSSLRDYIDVFLEKRRLSKEDGNLENSSFTKDRLIAITLNLFFVGTETISTTLYWAMKLLMAHPDVQEKMQKELDDVVGRDRLPSWLDRKNLPYIEAVILEIQRVASIVPFVIIHSNPEEATLRGYTIPKRSYIFGNAFSALRDPLYWRDPERFDPSRFLNQEGKAEKNESFIPFGIGKRVCIGEGLAKMEIYLFLTSIIHNFKILPPAGEKIEFKPVTTFPFRILLPYRFCAIPR